MRIGIDGRPRGSWRTGIGNYVHGLVQLLPQVAPGHQYFLYSNKEIDLALDETRVRKQIDGSFRLWPGSLWHLTRCGGLARKDRLDVFWSTAAILPAHMPAGVFKIVTVYDLVWLRFPETMTGYTFLVHKMCARRAITSADLIVVISRSTGDDLVRLLGVPTQKIKLVYPGISERYKPQGPEKAAAYISAKYRVPLRYMAAVGTVEPRKNLKLLVEVLRILKSNGQLDCPLLVAGAKGWKNSHLFQEIQAARLTENEIRFLGYLPDEDLPFFYAGAQLFLFPSLYEGFGFPPLEAMACGTPVIASNARCMPEVLGDAAILQSPTNANSFADAVARVLADESLRRSLRVAGIQQAQRFRWESSVKQLLEAFERPASVDQTDASVANETERRSNAPVLS